MNLANVDYGSMESRSYAWLKPGKGQPADPAPYEQMGYTVRECNTTFVQIEIGTVGVDMIEIMVGPTPHDYYAFVRTGDPTSPAVREIADEPLSKETLMEHLRLLAAAAKDPRLAPTLAAIPWLAPAMETLLKGTNP